MMLARWMRVVLSLILLSIFVLLYGCSGEVVPLARVNGQIITRHDLDHLIKLMRLCNPDLEEVILEQKDDSERRYAELEFLRILIDMELVRQEAERLSLLIDPAILKHKTNALVDRVVAAHYDGSPEMFHQRRKNLKLNPEELTIISQHELKLQALFNHLSDSVTDEELFQFIEENPELLYQPAALRLFRFTFYEESEARGTLDKFEQGVSVDQYLDKADNLLPGREAEDLGWITEDNPFVDSAARDSLFSVAQSPGGIIIKSGERYILYWISAVRPADYLNFETVKDRILIKKQHAVYHNYFNALWSEGEIEIYYVD